jgi:S-adenosylmethionine-diacylglycerol 3-amino-3-carboxypropyl transferase
MTEFATAASHDDVRYSQVWEDHRGLERALDVGPDDDVLSIASAGCNVLALLLHEPRSVTAIDISPAQIALLELKLAAIRELTTPDLAAFLGARAADGQEREETYRWLAPDLTPGTRAYWSEHLDVIRGGVIGQGMLDRYIRGFQDRYINRLVDPAAIQTLLDLDDLAAQRELFDRELTVLEQPVREWFGREGLSGRARDASQFQYVAGAYDVGAAFWRRFVEVCTQLPARGNFYLEWLLTGSYRDLAALGPPFLRPANHARLRGLVDRVTVVHDELTHHLRETPEGTYSAANLSDVFEYVSEPAADELLSLLATRLRPGGRLAYWNLFVTRSAATGGTADALHPHTELAGELFALDRVPFYNAFVVEAVRGPHTAAVGSSGDAGLGAPGHLPRGV